MHSLLRRQLKKAGLDPLTLSQPAQQLLHAVEAAYVQYDDDRRMMERSLELSSRELLEANAELRALLQSLPDLFLRLEPGGTITDCRGAAPADFCSTGSLLIGAPLHQVFTAPTAEVLSAAVAEVGRDKQRLSVEYEEPVAGGTHHFEARLAPVFGNQVLLIIRNISAVKTFEEAILRERAFLRLVIDLNPNFVFAKDRDGYFTLANQAMAAAYGTSVEGLLGKREADFNPDLTEVTRVLAEDRRVMDTLTDQFIPEEVITDVSGQRRWLQTVKRPIVGPDGRSNQVLGVASDITLRKEAQETLERRNAQTVKQQEALQELAALGGADPAIALGRACVLAAETLGVARTSIWYLDELGSEIRCAWLFADQTLQQDPGIVLKCADFPRYFAALEGPHTIAAHDARRDERTSEFTDSYLIPFGITAMLDCAIRVEGKPVGVLCIEHAGSARTWVLEEQDFANAVASFVALSRSIQQRKVLEDQLRHSQKMEAVGLLAGGIAHDFNNLLTAILGFSELILTHTALDEGTRGQLREIVRAGQRASELTGQLLAFGRKQVHNPRVIGLNTLVNNVSRMFTRLIGERIELRVVPGQPEPFVHADPNQLEQVLLNLVVNARDAIGPGGGSITIEAGIEHVGASSHNGSLPAGPCAYFCVRDTGQGIPPDILPRVFEPFFTTKRVGEGTGLGLAMVYGIVQQNQGHVELQSIVGRGTTARVLFSLVPAPLALPTVATPDGAVLGGSETILLVEDEAIVRLLAVQLLSRLGYQVLVAERPGAALAVAQDLAQTIDLLVTDVVMPEMNGQDLYREIVAVRPGLRVLYMSGYAPSGTLDTEVMEAGAVFLPKPFTMKRLADAIRASLRIPATHVP